jgi:alpha-tubulin suppressor-like RCC1 family protein
MPRDAPAQVGDGTSWLEVAAGEEHTCAIEAPGRLYCWGNNMSGQLGTGDAAGSQNEPMRVVTTYEDFEHVYAGGESTCAIRGGGALYCWGATGQLLSGTGDVMTPVVVAEPVIVIPGSNFTEVSIGSGHACGVRDDGVLMCWGQNGDGQLGIGTASDTTKLPTEIMGDNWQHVAAGDHHTCGIRAGIVYCWGRGDSGELGIANRRRTASPTRVTEMGTWASIDAGTNHTCAIARNTFLWCWGRNAEGQLAMSPSTMVGQPTQIGTIRYSQVALGETYTCAVNTGQTLLCWGRGDSGELGTGDTNPKMMPTEVRSN